MKITQAHIDFYRAHKVPAVSLQARLAPQSVFLRRLAAETPRSWSIDALINSQADGARKGTEPHNLLVFLRGTRARGESLTGYLYRTGWHPYGTDPKRRTAYARRWYTRLVQQGYNCALAVQR